MGYLHRVQPNKAITAQIEGCYNSKGQIVDPNTGKVLEAGKIDRGHKYGYEERAMQKCAEKCHMTQGEYAKMMQNPKLYQLEDQSSNRSGKFECKDYSTQLKNCFKVIREFQDKEKTHGKESQQNVAKAQVQSSAERMADRQSSSRSGQAAAGRNGTTGLGHSSTGSHGSTGGDHGGTGGTGGGHGGTGGGHGGR